MLALPLIRTSWWPVSRSHFHHVTYNVHSWCSVFYEKIGCLNNKTSVMEIPQGIRLKDDVTHLSMTLHPIPKRVSQSKSE